jgi:transcriptional regulator with XRE-family HTH domain
MTSGVAPRAGEQWLQKSEMPKIDPIVSAVQRIRLRKRLTQRLVADRMGSSPSRISEIERGGCSPSLNTLRRYMDACECYFDGKVKAR